VDDGKSLLPEAQALLAPSTWAQPHAILPDLVQGALEGVHPYHEHVFPIRSMQQQIALQSVPGIKRVQGHAGGHLPGH
jgi:hypothetical protein